MSKYCAMCAVKKHSLLRTKYFKIYFHVQLKKAICFQEERLHFIRTATKRVNLDWIIYYGKGCNVTERVFCIELLVVFSLKLHTKAFHLMIR